MIVLSTFDYALKIAINSIDANSLDEAVSQSSFGDAIWSGASSLVEDVKMGAALDCIRNILLADYSKETFNQQLLKCGENAAITYFTHTTLFSKDSRYATLLANQFRKHPRVTVAKLRNWGISKESILSISETLFASSEIETKDKIKELLK